MINAQSCVTKQVFYFYISFIQKSTFWYNNDYNCYKIPVNTDGNNFNNYNLYFTSLLSLT